MFVVLVHFVDLTDFNYLKALIDLNAVGMKIFPSRQPEKAIVDEAVDMIAMHGLMHDQGMFMPNTR